MINLLQSVIDKLDELFPDVNIYIKDVDQGLIEPCFFVRIANTNVALQFGKRYKVDSLVNIVYLDQNADAYKRQTVEQHLLYRMRNIELASGGIYGFNPNVKSNDEVNFTINYKYMTKEYIEPDPYMMENKIIHYTNEDSYEDATNKENPGMWKSPPWPEQVNVYPGIHPLDPRYEKDEKMWEVEDALMGKKEHDIYGRKK